MKKTLSTNRGARRALMLIALLGESAIAGLPEPVWDVTYDNGNTFAGPALALGEGGDVFAALGSFTGGTSQVQVVRLDALGNLETVFTVNAPGLWDNNPGLIVSPEFGVFVGTESSSGVTVRRVLDDGTFVYEAAVAGTALQLGIFDPSANTPPMALGLDGEIYVATESGGAFLTTRIDPNGEIAWERTFAHPKGQSQTPTDVICDARGHVTVAGYAQQSMPIVQYDSLGKVRWSDFAEGAEHPIGGPAQPFNASHLAVGQDGQVALIGNPESPCGQFEAFVHLYDVDGQLLWDTFVIDCAIGFPSTSLKAVKALVDTSGDVVVVGSGQVVDRPGPIESLIHVYRYDGLGNELWHVAHQPATTNLVEALDASIDAAGRVHVLGDHFNSSILTLLTVDAAGNEAFSTEWPLTAADFVVDDAGTLTTSGYVVNQDGDAVFQRFVVPGPAGVPALSTGASLLLAVLVVLAGTAVMRRRRSLTPQRH